MTDLESTRGGEVTAPSPSPASPPPAAVNALNTVMTADTSIAQLRAYADLANRVTDLRVAVRDDACGAHHENLRYQPLGAWFTACMRTPRAAAHTPANTRWAEPGEQPYPRFPTVDTCWIGGDS